MLLLPTQGKPLFGLTPCPAELSALTLHGVPRWQRARRKQRREESFHRKSSRHENV